jgi:hypothetical protein
VPNLVQAVFFGAKFWFFWAVVCVGFVEGDDAPVCLCRQRACGGAGDGG